MKQVKTRRKLEAMDIVATIIISLATLLVFVPFLSAVVASMVSAKEYASSPLLLWPKVVVWDNYQYLLSKDILWTGYRASIVLTVLGVVYGMFVSVLTAYGFSRRNYPCRKLLFRMMLITMFFEGGLVPTYMLIRNMKLIDSFWAVIFLISVSPFNIIIIKSGFEQTPRALTEAAAIDGANEISVFVRIMLPLQMPIIATFCLFIAVGMWNDWFWSMLVLDSREKMSLQLVLRSLINDSSESREAAMSGNMTAQVSYSLGIKMAAVVMTMLPIMCLYPFCQKYFKKGILVGAIKE